MTAEPVGMARGHTPHRDGGYSSERMVAAHQLMRRVLLCQPLVPPTFCARLSHLAHPFNADTGLVAARVLGTRSRSASSGRDLRPQLPRHRNFRVPSKRRRPRGRVPNRGARVHPHHPALQPPPREDLARRNRADSHLNAWWRQSSSAVRKPQTTEPDPAADASPPPAPRTFTNRGVASRQLWH